MKRNPLVYTLVLNYCSFEETTGCVEVLRQSRYRNNKIVIIDNASPDGSGEKLHTEFPEIEYLQLPKNAGYAGGNNYGIVQALKNNADFVFIVNPDARIEANTQTLLVNALRADSRRAAAMPLQLQPHGEEIDPMVCGILKKNGYSSTLSELKTDHAWLPLESVYGAALLLSASALNEVGLFDPLYFCYVEELDLCRRFRHFGYSLGMVPKAIAYHNRPYIYQDAADKMQAMRKYLLKRNRYLFALKEPRQNFKANVLAVLTLLQKSFFSAIRQPDFRDLCDTAKIITWLTSNFWKIKKNRESDLKCPKNRYFFHSVIVLGKIGVLDKIFDFSIISNFF